MWTVFIALATRSLLLCGAETSNRVFTMLSNNLYSWNHAWERCQSIGSRLVTIDSDNVPYALQYFSNRDFSAVWNQGGSTYWSGLHSCDPTHTFYAWADGTLLGGYQPWSSGGLSVGACVAFNGALQEEAFWETESCANPAHVICEKVEGTCSFLEYSGSTLPSNPLLDLLQSSISSASQCRQRCLDYSGPGECAAVTFDALVILPLCTLHLDISLRDIESQRFSPLLSTATLYVKFCFEADVIEIPVTTECIDNITDTVPWKACANISRTTTDYQVNPSCSFPVDEYIESTYLYPSSMTKSTMESSFLETPLLSSDSSNWLPLDASSVYSELLTSYSSSSFTFYQTSSQLPDVSSYGETGEETSLISWFFTTEAVDITPTTTTTTVTTALSDSSALAIISSGVDLVKPLLTHVDLPLTPTKVLTIGSIPTLLCTCCKRKSSVIPNVLIEDVLQELSIDFQNTSSYQRKFISVYEDRASVVAMGYLGIAMICALFGGLLVSDTLIILRDLRSLPYPVVKHRKPGQSLPYPESTETGLGETHI